MRNEPLLMLLMLSATALSACTDDASGDSTSDDGGGASDAGGGGTINSGGGGAGATGAIGGTNSVGGAGGTGGEENGYAVSVAWSNYEESEGCFLLSDPVGLGGTAWLETTDGTTTLSFPIPMRTYSGADQAGALTINGMHEESFDGEVWQYTESFVGTMDQETFNGTWSYSECNFTVAPETCPADGACSGTATFAISRSR